MRFYAFDGPVDISAFDVKLRGMVFVDIRSALKQLFPVFIVHDLSQHVLHMFSLQCQLPELILLASIVRFITFVGMKRISRSMPEDLVNLDEFPAGRTNDKEEEESQEMTF